MTPKDSSSPSNAGAEAYWLRTIEEDRAESAPPPAGWQQEDER